MAVGTQIDIGWVTVDMGGMMFKDPKPLWIFGKKKSLINVTKL